MVDAVRVAHHQCRHICSEVAPLDALRHEPLVGGNEVVRGDVGREEVGVSDAVRQMTQRLPATVHDLRVQVRGAFQGVVEVVDQGREQGLAARLVQVFDGRFDGPRRGVAVGDERVHASSSLRHGLSGAGLVGECGAVAQGAAHAAALARRSRTLPVRAS